jgi:four helix bundle protein
MSFKSFEELDCWNAARDLRLFVEKIIIKFPSTEKYDLIDNMRRASRSATRNISEGFGRFHYQENIQFCRQSRGSQHEILDDLITAHDNKFVSEEDYTTGRKLIDKSIDILNGYINYLEKAKNSDSSRVKEPDESYSI